MSKEQQCTREGMCMCKTHSFVFFCKICYSLLLFCKMNWATKKCFLLNFRSSSITITLTYHGNHLVPSTPSQPLTSLRGIITYIQDPKDERNKTKKKGFPLNEFNH